jgi:acyl carrier protein
MSVIETVKNILANTLGLGARKSSLSQSTALLGNIPELDSVAVVSVIAALEDHFGFSVEDDEINADTFATLGNLTNFVESKLNEAQHS